MVKIIINDSVESDVINRPKSIDFRLICFRFVVFSGARTKFEDITKISLQLLLRFLVKCTNEVFSVFPKKVTIETGIAVNILAR